MVLIGKRHPQQAEIKEQVQRLMAKWQELLDASNNRGKGLEEAKDILEFNEQVDKVEMWIREKVGVLASSAKGLAV
jgi:spectrin beta